MNHWYDQLAVVSMEMLIKVVVDGLPFHSSLISVVQGEMNSG
jgi:hypothetical protein